MYKIETHLHTSHVSKCGWLDAPTLIAGYKAAGYDAIIVTDHYNRITFDYLGCDPAAPGDKVHRFLEGYYRMVEEGEKQGVRVFKGAELRFDESENDYLLYGYRDDLLSDPEAIFRMGIAAFAPIARSQGALIIQAHPYRKKCTPAIACYLDGVEVCNMNPRHESYNERAEEYAQQFGLIRLAGSDCHRTEDIAITGILTSELPSDSLGMSRLIRSRRYTLIGEE
ncbi:MAG: PHP domain-containing protein [Oscillospiraceae bacterium]|nr:PHP domain-containing protein [Oscillospiraceae bacterium]